jgi:hypothetical protein
MSVVLLDISKNLLFLGSYAFVYQIKGPQSKESCTKSRAVQVLFTV